MAIAKVIKEALWLARLVKDLGIQQGVQLHCDSYSAIFWKNN